MAESRLPSPEALALWQQLHTAAASLGGEQGPFSNQAGGAIAALVSWAEKQPVLAIAECVPLFAAAHWFRCRIAVAFACISNSCHFNVCV